MQQLTPDVREKLQRFEKIRQWYRDFYTASGVQGDLIKRDCWNAAIGELPLTPEEIGMYEHHLELGTLSGGKFGGHG
jgi:hypothetical protein